jgi:hypothetical protein
LPPLTLDLKQLRAARARLSATDSEQAQLDTRILDTLKLQDQARSQGATAAQETEIEKTLLRLRRDRGLLAARRGELFGSVENLAKGLLGGRDDPAQMAEALHGNLPVALFPIRIETRFLTDRNAWRIRVYPDVLHVVAHAKELTEKEQAAGREYWAAQFGKEEEEAKRILRDMARAYGSNRALWILRTLTPENRSQAGRTGAKPHFPSLPTIDRRVKRTRAVLLPDRWCFLGYAGKREVFRAWGERIPDELAMSPHWFAADGEREALFAGDRKWLVDFEAAVANGMAYELTQTFVDDYNRKKGAPPFLLKSDVVERLLVVGLEWTKDATETAEELADLFSSHRDSRGFGFVGALTPTNNTDEGASGYSPKMEREAPASPQADAASPEEKDAFDLFREAFGLPAKNFVEEGVRGSHLAEQRTALHMMNVLWRGTFGHYLMEMWNPPGGEESSLYIKTSAAYLLREYAVRYLRPGGALPTLRIGSQPYGILPVTGKRFRDPQDDASETAISKVLGLARPLWDLSLPRVTLLKDASMTDAMDILQTAPCSQAAYYRDADPDNASTIAKYKANLPKQLLIANVLALFGVANDPPLVVLNGQDFLEDPPFGPGYLAAVPWVLADQQDPLREAPAIAGFTGAQNYIQSIANALRDPPATGDPVLDSFQSGPALLQSLLAFSVKMERHDAVVSLALGHSVISQTVSLRLPKQVYIEPAHETENTFEVRTPKELASLVVPSLPGPSTLGEYVPRELSAHPPTLPRARATMAAQELWQATLAVSPPLRNMAAALLSLDYLGGRTIGELNWAMRTTLDAFSYRLDAWYTARASRRLERFRAKQPEGIYVGAFGWVENLKPDNRPDSSGHVFAPSLAQAATAAILRSGFLANHEQGAFNIDLRSKRTRRAMDLLAGLTADQPLAALYGYRLERALRDQELGKLIWPMRLAYPWRPAGEDASEEPKEAVSARDVVDGVSFLSDWADPAKAIARLRGVNLDEGHENPFKRLPKADWETFRAAVEEVRELADAASDLLMAEGIYQIVQGNFERAGAAIAVADKQALPIEPQVVRTPRDGVGYVQRLAVLCPQPKKRLWPQDRKAAVEPRLNAWLEHMLGEPGRFVFAAEVSRKQSPTKQKKTLSGAELGLSALAAVLAATAVSSEQDKAAASTNFRGVLAARFLMELKNTEDVTIEIGSQGAEPENLGLEAFEAMAMALRQLIDKMRPMTRKDLVVSQDEMEKDAPVEGEYPGVDLAELEQRAKKLGEEFENLAEKIQTASAATFLEKLSSFEDFLPRSSWPPEFLALPSQTDPAKRSEAVEAARRRFDEIVREKRTQLADPLAQGTEGAAKKSSEKKKKEKPATHGQRVQKAIARIKTLLGKDFPVLPQFSLGAYGSGFHASLAEQDELTAHDPWRITGWIPKLARVRDGVDRFCAALSARDALVGLSAAEEFKVVQLPHRKGQIWAALPEAWNTEPSDEGKRDRFPEELRDLLKEEGSVPKDLNRTRPQLALVLHLPGNQNLDSGSGLAGFVCDDWQELIPDRFQTSAISFQYDAPGAQPPQTILLALPPAADQERWQFDDIVDVVQESFDLGQLRALRPKDLGSALGSVLPGNYLPQNYTDDLPSVKMLQMVREALQRALKTEVRVMDTLALGKV